MSSSSPILTPRGLLCAELSDQAPENRSHGGRRRVVRARTCLQRMHSRARDALAQQQPPLLSRASQQKHDPAAYGCCRSNPSSHHEAYISPAVCDSAGYASTSGSNRPSHFVRCGWFWAWGAVGATVAAGLVSLGPVALIPATVAGAAMARSGNAQRSIFGLLAGVGLLSLFVAYVQRDGPGTTCWHIATGTGCDQHLSPIPWLVVGLLLVLGAVVGQIRQR